MTEQDILQPEIRRATLTDFGEVMSILDEAGAWLHSQGITEQWPLSFSSDEETVRRFENYVASGTVYIALVGDVTVGVYRLTEIDADVWPEGRPGEALYLNSFAVRRSVAGKGLASTMLEHARSEAGLRRCAELRLDCWAGNERLKKYYFDLGFAARGEIARRLKTRTYWVARFAIRAIPAD